MTDRAAAAGFTLMLVCFTAYLCFRGIAWVVQNGWRSMLGLVALRGEAILTVESMSCGCAYAGVEYGCMRCGHSRCARHRDMPHDCTTKPDDFAMWTAELACRPRIRQYEKRMDAS